MKWNDVSKKEPPYDEKLLFSKGVNDWESGYLDQVIGSKDGKVISFHSGDNQFDGYKFWAKPEGINIKK